MVMSKTFHEKTAFYEKIVALLAGDSGSAKGLGVAISARSNAWGEVISQSINPMDYQTPGDFLTDLLCKDFVRKARDLPIKLDRKDVAYSAFMLAERRCKDTNARLGRHGATFLQEGFETIISIAQRKIGAILHDFSYVAALSGCYQGSGSTVSIKLEDAGFDTKYDESRISVTRDAVALARICSLGTAWPMARGIECEGPCSMPWEWQIAVGDKLAFVPKSAKTDRTIAIGPTCNVYMQLGVGEYLRKCLLRAHIDIRDQGVNSGLAQQGSLFDNLATVDLEAASDSLSIALVRLLVPPALYELMDTLRSKEYIDPVLKRTSRYEKFSGMGNGFTFPLQTLIYWGLATAVCEEQGISREVYGGWVGVFGDDIIVPANVYPRLLEVLAFCGFKTNESKSFASGPFRESCGGQYFLGSDVRPVTWEGFDGPEVTPWEIAKIAHSIKLLRDRTDRLGCTYRFTRTLGFLRALYTSKCESGAFGDAAKRKPPFVPIWAPAGSGFPCDELSKATTPMKLGCWTFRPEYRPGRDGAVYCAFLNQMERRPKRLSLLEERLRHLPWPDVSVPYEGHINVPRRGRFKVTASVVYPR